MLRAPTTEGTWDLYQIHPDAPKWIQMLSNAPTRPPAAVFLTLSTPGLVQNSPKCSQIYPNVPKCSNTTTRCGVSHIVHSGTCTKFIKMLPNGPKCSQMLQRDHPLRCFSHCPLRDFYPIHQNAPKWTQMFSNAPTRPPAAVFITLSTPGLIQNSPKCSQMNPNAPKCSNATTRCGVSHIGHSGTCTK